MSIQNNTLLIEALTGINDKTLPIFFREQDGTQFPPTYLDSSVDGLVEINVNNDSPAITTETLIKLLKEDKAVHGENYTTVWTDFGDRLEILSIESTELYTLVHLCG